MSHPPPAVAVLHQHMPDVTSFEACPVAFLKSLESGSVQACVSLLRFSPQKSRRTGGM
jgi:hypothetical protein